MIDKVATLIDSVRGDFAKARILNSDLTLTPCYIAKVGNYFAHGLSLKQAYKDALDKAMESMSEEDRIEQFRAKYPSLDCKDTCAELSKWHHILTGSCSMGRELFIKEHGLDLDKEYTVGYFLDITESSYGGNIIKQVKENYYNE